MTVEPGQYGIEAVISGALVHPGYRKTVTNLRADESKAGSQSSALHFTDYAFEPASVFPVGLVVPEQIVEINLQCHSQVRLTTGEILFVRPAYKEELVTFVNRHELPVRRRSSVWSALLDPFLDTWEEQQVIDRQFEWFARLGLDRDTDRPDVCVDNNYLENQIRPFAQGRRVWLFAQTKQGARASANLYSLVSCARVNGLEPYAYLRHLFEELPKATTAEGLEFLLP